MKQLSLVPVCEKHGVEKAWIKDKSNRNGGVHRCRECNREQSLARNARNRANPAKKAEINAGQRRRYRKRNYGLSQADYDLMLQSQGGVCAICGSREVGSSAGHHPDFFVDHDHGTGAVRGLLCHPCNVGIGCFQDNIGRLEAAVRYLNARSLGAATQAA